MTVPIAAADAARASCRVICRRTVFERTVADPQPLRAPRFWCRRRRIVDRFADHVQMSDRENKPCGNAEIPGRAA
jgi:hypothetical protein